MQARSRGTPFALGVPCAMGNELERAAGGKDAKQSEAQREPEPEPMKELPGARVKGVIHTKKACRAPMLLPAVPAKTVADVM